MKHLGAIAFAALLAAGIGPDGHAAEGVGGQAVTLAQASPGSGAGGYDPMARPINPMMPGTPSGEDGGVPLNPELGNLPDTPGAEEPFYLCSACHSVAIIKQQRLSDARWDYLWTWMIEEQGMPEQDPETRETILSYLKRHFSSERRP